MSRCPSRRGHLSIHPEARGGSGRLRLSGQRGRHWKARLEACSPLLTLMSGLIILLPFLSLGHCDPLSSDHLALWRHSPEAQVTIGKLLPEERSGPWAPKTQQLLDPSPSSQASSHASVAGVIVYRLSGDSVWGCPEGDLVSLSSASQLPALPQLSVCGWWCGSRPRLTFIWPGFQAGGGPGWVALNEV